MKKPILPFIIIALSVCAVLVLLLQLGVFSAWQHRFSDALYGGAEPLKNIAIIAVDDRSLQETGRWPWDRTEFAKLLGRINDSRVIAFDIAFFEPTKNDAVLGDAMFALGNVIIPKEAAKFTKLNSAISAEKWLEPVELLGDIPTGVVNIFTDPDGVSRTIPASIDGEKSMAFAVAEKFTGQEPGFKEPKMLVNFVGKPFSFTKYSFSDVAKGRIAPEVFRNKIVLIGATAPDLHDDYLVPTSWGQRMPGVEIHANAVQTILTKQYLHYQSFPGTAIAILAVSLITALLFWAFRTAFAGIGTVFVLIAIFISGILLYNKGILVNLVHQPLAAVLTAVLCTAFIARHEAKHKKHILSVFGRYVSKDVVSHLLKSEKSLELGGEERNISVLFVDIRGFTALSEKLKPKKVIDFLNHYFGEMTDIIFKNNGTLDKFMGDCIMAVFNSPHHEPDHAFKAVKTAVEMQEACKKLKTRKVPKVNLGIGVNTGTAIIGNMGSSQRQEFTALGDTVNTASRLCSSAAKSQILISDATYQIVKNKIKAKKLKAIKVKGKKKPLVVYEVKGIRK